MLVREQRCIAAAVACAIIGDNDYRIQLGVTSKNLDLHKLPKDAQFPLRLYLVGNRADKAQILTDFRQILAKATYLWYSAGKPTNSVPAEELQCVLYQLVSNHEEFWRNEHGIYFTTGVFFERYDERDGQIVLLLARKGDPDSYGLITIPGEALLGILRLRAMLHPNANPRCITALRWFDLRFAKSPAAEDYQMRLYTYKNIHATRPGELTANREEYRLSDARIIHDGDTTYAAIDLVELENEVVLPPICL